MAKMTKSMISDEMFDEREMALLAAKYFGA